MFRKKYTVSLRIAVGAVALALWLMPLADATAAARTASKDNKSSSSNSSGSRAAVSRSAAPTVRRSATTSRTPSRVTTPTRSSRSPAVSRLPSRTSPTQTTRPSVSRSPSVVRGSRPTGLASSRVLQSRSSITSISRRPSIGLSANKGPTSTSSAARQTAPAGPQSRVTVARPGGSAGSINQSSAVAPAPVKTPVATPSRGTSTVRSSRLSSVLGTDRPSTSLSQRMPTPSVRTSTSLRNTSRIGTMVGGQSASAPKEFMPSVGQPPVSTRSSVASRIGSPTAKTETPSSASVKQSRSSSIERTRSASSSRLSELLEAKRSQVFSRLRPSTTSTVGSGSRGQITHSDKPSGSRATVARPTAKQPATSTREQVASKITTRSGSTVSKQEGSTSAIRRAVDRIRNRLTSRDTTRKIASPIQTKATPAGANKQPARQSASRNTNQDRVSRTTEGKRSAASRGEPANATESRQADSRGEAGRQFSRSASNTLERLRAARQLRPGGSRVSKEVGATQAAPAPGAGPARASKNASGRPAGGLAGTPRSRKAADGQHMSATNHTAVSSIGDRDRSGVYRSARYGSRHVLYQDRPHLVGRIHSNVHVYRDWHDRMCHRIIWPRYHFPVYYHWGPSWTVRYVYPYHLRKYVFVSLGGYWPIEYGYTRYYWYGYHPYYWCGYYPVAREVVGDTYNYYTYNYYADDGTVYSGPDPIADGIQPVDHTTFADVRAKLAQEAAEPDEPTLADAYFEEAVKAFEVGDYETAVEKFGVAMEFAPDDVVLPFAYAQALMANEQYSEAAEVLRTALENVSPEKEGVFYPRGLYPDEDVLLEQIDRLAEETDVYVYDADLQLLLGYQRLGMGEAQEALDPLRRAVQDLENATAAKVLIDLAEKITAADGEAENPTE